MCSIKTDCSAYGIVAKSDGNGFVLASTPAGKGTDFMVFDMPHAIPGYGHPDPEVPDTDVVAHVVFDVVTVRTRDGCAMRLVAKRVTVFDSRRAETLHAWLDSALPC